jgi:hypothetical protein
MATVKKIYLDSRFAEGNGSDFTVELPETVNCGPDTVAYVTDVCFPVAWHTININNSRLFMIEKRSADFPPQARVIEIPIKDYTLGSDLVAQVQSALNLDGPSVAARKNVVGSYAVSFNQSTFALTVTLSGGGQFTILSYNQLRNPYFYLRWKFLATQSFAIVVQLDPSFQYERLNPKTANGVLRIGLGEDDIYTLGTTMVGGSIDLRPCHTIYLTSPNFSNNDVLGPNGGLRNTIRRIAITEPAKGLQYSEHSGHSEDFISCGGMSLRTLRFTLRDSFGNIVTMNGGHCAFSLLFAERP